MSEPRKLSRSGHKPLQRWLALGASLAITLGGGALYGNYAQRWGPPADLHSAAVKLEILPRKLGPWTLVEELPFDQATREMLECAGFVNRRYLHEGTGKNVCLAIIVGPPGPTAVHTPEICFSSRAYQQQDQRRRSVLSASPDEPQSFWMVDFTTRNVLSERLRVYYAWSRGQTWEAAASPRLEFGGAPLLYKLQLAAPIDPRSANGDSDVCREFLTELLRSGWPKVRQ